MLVGIMSDSHDNLPLIDKALSALKTHGAETILHAGDVISPFAAKKIAAAGIPVIAVYGNCDGEKKGLASILDIAHGPRRIELGGRSRASSARTIVMAHSSAEIPDEAKDGADVLIYGHTHKALLEEGPPLEVNPGECGGWLSGNPTVAILDTADLSVEIIEL